MSGDVDQLVPKPPAFPAEVVEECRQTKDFRPILFEWYKYVGKLCNMMARLDASSPALRPLPGVHYAVLIGLLNRCSRLMVANVRLSCTGRYGETTRLIDRSIAETAVKIQWLCREDGPEGFARYIADALRNDLLLKDHIEENIRNRGGNALVIERRMLDSIRRYIERGGMAESEVRAARRLPDFASLCRDIGFEDQFYLVVQRMGSHAVHGTWSDLLSNYLRHEEGQGFLPRDHNVETQDVQYIVVCRLVLGAIVSFIDYVNQDADMARGFRLIAEGIEAELVDIQDRAWGTDFGQGGAP
jgi:Family of unknown function (DUF5677)